jgi:hypothetical protein
VRVGSGLVFRKVVGVFVCVCVDMINLKEILQGLHLQVTFL